MRSLDWPESNMTGVLVRRGDWEDSARHRGKTVIYEPRSVASEETNPTDT